MKPKSNYMSPEQMDQLIDYIPQLKIRKWLDKDVAMTMKIAYWIGLRPGEVVRLKAEDFDLERREVYLGKTKTTKEEYRKISKPFIPELRRYLQNKKGPLLPDCSVQNLYKWLIKAGIALNIEALTTPQSVTGEKTKGHIFRKSLGKDLYFGVITGGRRIHIGFISAQLGHGGPTTTEKYLKLKNEAAVEIWEPKTNDQIELN